VSRSRRATRPATDAKELSRFEAERDTDLGAERRLLFAEVLIVAVITTLLIVARSATG
jgi:hypothetical protein